MARLAALQAVAGVPPALAMAALGALALLLLALLWPAGGDRARCAARAAQVAAARRPGAGERGPEIAATMRRRERVAVFGGVSRLFRELVPRVAALRHRLERAGLAIGPADYVLCVVLGAAAAGGLVQWRLHPPLILTLGLVLALGAALPNMYLAGCIRRRTARFLGQLPEAVDLIVRGIRSGLPVTEAMASIGAEMGAPVALPFREINGQLRMGKTLDEALWNAARRLAIPEFNFFAISLSIQQETGGNLAEILENLSHMVRRREQLKLKIKAMSSEARASAMIIGSLPFIMCAIIYLVNPGYIAQLFIDPRGWLLLAAGATSLAMGVFVMVKMVRFQI